MPDTNRKAPIDSRLDVLLRSAIEKKQLIRFGYKGKSRIAEPHDYGVQNGVVRLFCYQVGGQSDSRLPGWRLVDVSEMQDCEVLDRSFPGNREVPGAHRKWDVVFIRVGPPTKD